MGWHHLPCGYETKYIQCGVVITLPIFTQILTKGTPELARESEVWGVFCEFSLWLSSGPVVTVLYTI